MPGRSASSCARSSSSLPAMNPDFRKVALIAAGLGLLVSLYFALRPGDDNEAASTTTAVTTTAPTTTEAPPATTEAPPATTTEAATAPVQVDVVVVGGEPQGGIVRESVDLDSAVVLTVTSDVADEVHVHGYDLMADVAPGAPATIRFTADAPGRFEIELENTRRPDRRARGSPLSLLAHGIGGRRGPARSRVALLLGRRGRPRPLVPRARRALEDAAARAAARWAAAAGEGSSGCCARPSCTSSLGAISAGLLVARLPDRAASASRPRRRTSRRPSSTSIFWLGLVPLQVLFGNVWRVLNPWLAVAERRRVALAAARAGLDAAARLSGAARRLARRRSCCSASRRSSSPTPSPASPRALALAIALYSYAMWFGMAAYGRRTWDDARRTASPSTSACSRGSRPSASTTAGSSCAMPFSGLAGRASRRRACSRSSR